MSTSARILIAFLVLLFGGLVYLARDLTLRVERQYMEAAEEPMVDAAYLFASLVEQFTDDRGIQVDALRKSFARAHERRFSAKIYNFEKTKVKMHLYVTDADGLVLYDSRGEAEGQNYRRMLDVGRSLKGIYGARSSRTNESNDRSSILYVSAPVTLEGKIIKDCLTLYPDSSKLVKQVNMRWQMARMLIKAAKIVKKVQDGVGTALPRPASPIEMLDSQLKKKGAGSGSGSDDSDGLAAARRFAAREAVRAGAAKTVEERMDTVEKQLETVVGILKDISSRMGPRPSAGSRSNSPVNAPRSETWKMSNPMSA